MKLRGLEPEWFEHDGAKFQLIPLKWSQTLELGEHLQAGDLKAAFEYACDNSLTDWDGVEDANGPVKFDKDMAGLLPVDVVAVIAKRVIESNILGAEAEKNS